MSRSYRSFIFILNILLFVSLTACESTSSSSSSTSNSKPEPITAPPEPSVSTTAQPSDEGLTTEEMIDDLDAELDQSIAVFDGMILDERSKAEALVVDSHDPAGSGSDDPNEVLFEEGDLEEGLPGYGEFPETAEGSESESEANGGEEGGEYADASPGGESASPGSSASSGSIPEDIDDGSDDDIVARQIREAAQKEKDPVLREKLWEEYRKYKNQQRGD